MMLAGETRYFRQMRALLLSLLLTVNLLGYAQPELEIVRNLRKRDGLTSDQVSCMVMDGHGLLWIGTWGGLNRFDGAGFRNYFSDDDDSDGLPNNKIYDLLLTRSGLLLIATGDGLAVINTATGRFENGRIEYPGIRAGGGRAIHSLYEDPEGQVWVNYDGEFDILSEDLRFLYRFSDLPWATGLKGVSALYEDWQLDTQGRLWIPSDESGLQIVDFRDRAVYNRKHNPDKLDYLDYRHIRSFLLDEGSGRLWLGPWGAGLLGFSLHSGKLELEPLAGYPADEAQSVNMVLRQADGGLVFSFMGRIYQFDPGSGKLDDLLFSEDQGLSANAGEAVTLMAFCAYGSGRFFLGANGHGVFDVQTSPMLVRKDFREYLNGASVRRILELPGIGLFAITSRGEVLELDSQDLKVLNVYRSDRMLKHLLAGTFDGQRIWMASQDAFILFDAWERRHLRGPESLDTFQGWLISELYVDNRQGLWIATREPASLWRLDIPNGRLDRIPDSIILPLISNGHQSRIDQIEMDDQGVLWYSSLTANVILSFDPKSGQWAGHPQVAGECTVFPGEGVESMKPLDGKIWLTMKSGDGLFAYDPGTGWLDAFSRREGMPVNQLLILESGIARELWLISESAIIVYDPQKQRILGQWSPAGENIFIYPDWSRALITSKGPVVFSGGKVGRLRRPDIDQDTLLPEVILDAVSVNNRDVTFDARANILTLPSQDRNVTLSFVVADLTGVVPWAISYRLLGLDTSWTPAGTLRRVTYTHLRPDLYTFETRVAHPYTDRAVIHRLISFRIAPPLWQRWWFIFTVLGVLSTLVIWTVRWRIGSIRKAAALKLEITELEMKALQAQMNPHFIFNCLNSIDALVHGNEKQLATQFLNKFARLIRNVLDSSRQNVVPFSKDIETLRLYVELEQFRHDNRFDVAWEIDPQLLRGDFQVPPLIIQPFVENAILHGLGPRQQPGGVLLIRIALEDTIVKYKIEDNGVGRATLRDPATPERKSHGIQMTLDRIRLFNREEEPSVVMTDLVEDGHPAGTRVVVLLHVR